MKNKSRLFNIIFWLSNFVIWFVLYYSMIYLRNTGDYPAHNYFADLMMDGKFETVYMGYQVMVGIPHKIFGFSVEICSVFVLTLFAIFSIVMTYLLLVEIFDNKDKYEKWTLLIMSFVINFVQPIFTYSIRPGYSSGNGYISPTQAVCKPFAIWAILIVYRMVKKKEWEIREQIYLTIILVISCIMKPLFAMACVPAMGILYLIICIKERKKFKQIIKRYIVMVWPFFITGIVLVLQYIFSYYLEMPVDANYTLNGGAHMYFGFLVAWKLVVSNVPLSVIFAYFFPIVLFFIIFVQNRNIINTNEKIFLKIACTYGFVSLLYMMFIHQGLEETACDFRNAWVITFVLIYIVSVEILIRITKNCLIKKKAWIAVAWTSLSIHIVFGLLLYAKNVIAIM